jgi:hypothetical protein
MPRQKIKKYSALDMPETIDYIKCRGKFTAGLALEITAGLYFPDYPVFSIFLAVAGAKILCNDYRNWNDKIHKAQINGRQYYI